jgi:nucleoid-associated protein YgaU
VRPNEPDLYDVARRYYGDPSRASDIARANFKGGNPLSLGARLTAGTQLRMPA